MNNDAIVALVTALTALYILLGAGSVILWDSLGLFPSEWGDGFDWLIGGLWPISPLILLGYHVRKKKRKRQEALRTGDVNKV
jgi:hypothetical protein